MFQKDDLVVYGRTGVCRVTDVTEPDFCRSRPGGADTLYYVLDPLYQDGTIYAPVNNSKVPMRPILTAEEAKRLVDTIPASQAKAYCGGSTQNLREHYQTQLQTGDCEVLLELVISIHSKRAHMEQSKRKFGAVDEHFMKQAEQLLGGELAAALNLPVNEVLDRIAAKLRARDAVPAPELA